MGILSSLSLGFRLRGLPETPNRLSARARGAQRATAGLPWPLFGRSKPSSHFDGLVASPYAEHICPIDDDSITNITYNGNTTNIHTQSDIIPPILRQVVPPRSSHHCHALFTNRAQRTWTAFSSAESEIFGVTSFVGSWPSVRQW